MTYRRVIPRDLFNEADLLKCYGRLAILLDELPKNAAIMHHLGGAFEPVQDQSDGSLTLYPSIEFYIAHRGGCRLHRPLNSREPWPLYATLLDGKSEEIAVFSRIGDLTDEFKRMIGL